MTHCEGKTRSGGLCRRPAGWGTAHVGTGHCKLHGGCATGRPPITGRYSVVHRRSLAEKMATMAADPTPGELWQELSLQRALLDEYLARFPDGQAMPADDIERLFGWLESIGKQTERIHKIMAQTALTVAEVNYLQAVLADLLKRYISEDKRRRFMEELAHITGNPLFDGRLSDTVIRAEHGIDVTKLTDSELQDIVELGERVKRR